MKKSRPAAAAPGPMQQRLDSFFRPKPTALSESTTFQQADQTLKASQPQKQASQHQSQSAKKREAPPVSLDEDISPSKRQKVQENIDLQQVAQIKSPQKSNRRSSLQPGPSQAPDEDSTAWLSDFFGTADQNQASATSILNSQQHSPTSAHPQRRLSTSFSFDFGEHSDGEDILNRSLPGNNTAASHTFQSPARGAPRPRLEDGKIILEDDEVFDIESPIKIKRPSQQSAPVGALPSPPRPSLFSHIREAQLKEYNEKLQQSRASQQVTVKPEPITSPPPSVAASAKMHQQTYNNNTNALMVDIKDEEDEFCEVEVPFGAQPKPTTKAAPKSSSTSTQRLSLPPKQSSPTPTPISRVSSSSRLPARISTEADIDEHHDREPTDSSSASAKKFLLSPPSSTKRTGHGGATISGLVSTREHPLHIPPVCTNLAQSLEEFEQFTNWIMDPESGIDACAFTVLLSRHDVSSFRITDELERSISGTHLRALMLLFPTPEGGPGAAACIPLMDELESSPEVPLAMRTKLALDILAIAPIERKICYNSKLICKALLQLDPQWRPQKIFDVQIAAYTIDPELSNRFGFQNLVKQFLREEVKIPPSLSGTPPSVAVLLDDFASVQRLAGVLEKRLHEDDLWVAFWDQERVVATILAKMELDGIEFDSNALATVGQRLNVYMRDLQAQANATCGFEVLLSSPKSVGEALFKRLNLKAATITSGLTRGGAMSTSEDVLKSIEKMHPLPGLVLQFRKAQKLATTYVESLGGKVAKDGRIHTFWDQMGTGTGRLSSRDPNMQNLPRTPFAFKMKDSKSSNAEVCFNVSIRSAFLAGNGMVLVGADYSQLEMRILAHVAQEKTLEEFFRSGRDVHSQVASHWKKKQIDQVTKQEREYAKRLVYGIMYGMGPNALADHLGVSKVEARRFMAEFMSSYPAVKRWIDKTVVEASKAHFVRTLYGRRRLLVADGEDARRADRQAVNSIVQGTAADIVKRAMVSIDDKIRLIPTTRLLVQVHDELIFECREQDARATLQMIKTEMEGASELSVPLPVELKMGKTWASLGPVDLNDPTAFECVSQEYSAAVVDGIDLVEEDVDDDIFGQY